jgi:hypothetical protein
MSYSMNMTSLISTIQAEVKTIATTHIEKHLKDIATGIAKVYKLDEAAVLVEIQKMIETDPQKKVTKKKDEIPPVEQKPCCMMTKAGTPCKYKCVIDERFCKKHCKMNETQGSTSTVAHLPVDEQEWLNEQSSYKASFFPKYENKDVTMDTDIIDDSHIVDDE